MGMRVYEPIENEIKSVYSGETRIPIYINPSYKSLIRILNNSKEQILRGYYVKYRFYFWDAYYMIHVDITKRLGLKYESYRRLEIYKQNENIMLLRPQGSILKIKNKFYIKNNFDLVKNELNDYLSLKENCD